MIEKKKNDPLNDSRKLDRVVSPIAIGTRL